MLIFIQHINILSNFAAQIKTFVNFTTIDRYILMRNSLLLTTLLLAIASGDVMAQTVSESEARDKALAFISHGRRAPGRDASDLQLAYTSATETETHYYVFNYGTNDGYIIVGGDMAAQEVLAYAETGHFDYEALPPQMKDWLTGYSDQIHEAIRQVKAGEAVILDQAGKKQSSGRAPGRSNISPMLTTKWDQIAPYNSQMPLNQQSGFTGAYSFATGCVATAGAQVMKYHNWPDSGVGSHSSSHRINGVTFSADFGNTVYRWDKMQDTYDTEGKQYGVYHGTESEIAVGTLMYHIGVSVDMQYGQFRSNGSSSSCFDLAKSLITYFKYSKMISYEERNTYTDQDWEDRIYTELAASRPVVYRGSAADGSGHAFVCDGYRDGRFHINWGWNGSYNDYFLLTPTATEKALTPNGTGSGGGAAGSSYTTDQGAIVNIMPDPDGTSEVHKAMCTDGYYLDKDEGYPGGTNILHGAIYSKSLAETEFTYGMRYVNVNDENDVVVSPMYLTNTLKPNWGSTYHQFTISKDVTVGETYYVYPMFIGDDGEWEEVRISGNPEIPTLTITAPQGFVLTQDIVISNNGYVSPSTKSAFSFAVKNYGPADYFWAYISNPGWSQNYMYYSCGSVANNVENNYSLNMSGFRKMNDNLSMTFGEDYAIYVYRNYKISPHVVFHYVEDLPIDFTMSAAGWGTICLPYESAVPSGLKAYSITGVDGNKLLLEPVEKMEMNTPYLLNGTQGTYSFVGPDTPMVPDYIDGLLAGNVSPSTDNSPVYAPAGSYVLQQKNGKLGFYLVENDNTQKIRQYSAYLQIEEAAPALAGQRAFYFDIDAEGIEEIANDESHYGVAYGINGQRVEANHKGLTVRNGKISFIK